MNSNQKRDVDEMSRRSETNLYREDSRRPDSLNTFYAANIPLDPEDPMTYDESIQELVPKKMTSKVGEVRRTRPSKNFHLD